MALAKKHWRSVKLGTFCFSVAFFAISAVSARAMSLDDALAAAYAYSHRLKAEQAQVKNVNENASQAFSEWLPSVEAGYSRGKKDIEFGGNASDGDTDTRSLSLSQPLFNGGGTVAKMHQADHRINAAEARLLAVEQEVLLEAATAYLNVVRDTELLEISRHNEQVLAEHFDASKERFRLGEITKTDVSQSEARHALSISQLTLAEGTLAASRASFKRAIGQEPVAAMLPKNNEPKLPASVLPKLLEIAEVSHPSVIAAQQDMLDAERDISIQKSRILPSVSFNASHVEEEGVFAFSSGDTESTTKTYTVDVSIPLFQSGAEYSRVRQAKHATEVLRQNLEQEQEQVHENVIRSFHDLHAAKASILSNESAVRAAEVALDGVKKEAKAGSRTTLDVLDAEQELFTAKQELISARRDALVSVYALLSSIGSLNAETLNLKVEKLFNPKQYREDAQYQIIGF